MKCPILETSTCMGAARRVPNDTLGFVWQERLQMPAAKPISEFPQENWSLMRPGLYCLASRYRTPMVNRIVATRDANNNYAPSDRHGTP